MRSAELSCRSFGSLRLTLRVAAGGGVASTKR